MLNILAFAALYSCRVGRAWRSIKVNAQLAETLGISLYRYRLLAFIISSASAGLAGSFYTHYFQALEPGMFTAFKSINVQIFAILGGLNYYIVGPAVGAAIMTFVPELLRVGKEIEPVITGAVLIFLVIFLPGGVISLKDRLGSFPLRLIRRAKSEKVPVRPGTTEV
jgi:branched-chain amino acid transport system permease protein